VDNLVVVCSLPLSAEGWGLRFRDYTPRHWKKGCDMLLVSGASVAPFREDADEFEDISVTLRRLLAPALGLKPEEITPADVQSFRSEHIYPNMKLDRRNERGGFVHHLKEHLLTEREIKNLRDKTDEFFASLEH
jgi:hypothetical protein